MYKTYDHIDDPRLRHALEALDHPDGEEYQGAHDCYKELAAQYGYYEYDDDEKTYRKRSVM